MMWLGTRQECVRSSPGYRELARMAQGSSPEEDRDLLEDCRGFNHDGISYISYMNPGSSLDIGQGLDDAVGAHRAFARTSPKVSGILLGTCWEIAGGRP
ncbi:hypothetical protein B296_00041700 [Ensete ventricosum]|uniref:Uncharacterized protein n=1 Tax=Ensete ventricosum TaxID=4639 RepID=A0A426XB08_ENSVE|nr:hypothetical protein B296_00041700 [Ensete ventricosum]